MSRRTGDLLPGIPARYGATCPRCDEPIQRGDRVVHQRGHYLHVGCVSGADDE